MRFFKESYRRFLRIIIAVVFVFGASSMAFSSKAYASTPWTPQTVGGNDLGHVSYGNGLWVMTDNDGGYYTSTNGINWSTVYSAPSVLYPALYTGSLWIAGAMTPGSGQSNIYTTTDPTNTQLWTKQTTSASNDIYGLATNGSTIVAVGSAGTIMHSSDETGVSWANSTLTPTTANDFYGVAYGNNTFVAVGQGGAIYTSPDGVTWASHNYNGNNLQAVAYGDGKFVAVGQSGLVLTSTDGSTWTSQTSGLSTDPSFTADSVAYGAGKFVVSADNDNIISSTDGGVTWTSERSNASANYLLSVAYGGSMFEVVGESGEVLYQQQSTDATLSGLTLTPGTLSPVFASGTTTYTASVPYSTTSVVVNPTTNYPGATVTVKGASPTTAVPLAVGTNTIPVVVTAQDGTTQKTYTITVTRAAASTNATLSNLTISSGTLNPSFSTSTTSYTASVGNATSSVNVTPTVTDSTATVTVNGTSVTSGSAATVPLNVGSNTITVLVTAQDGTTTKTYTITVTRAAPLSSNADLSGLSLSSGTLNTAFAAGTTNYSATVTNSTTSVDVTPTVADSTSTVMVNGNSVTSGSAYTVPLNVGSNTITVVVTAQDGTTTKAYTVTVTRPSNNADLSDLTISAGTLSPVFASGTTDYTASVVNGITSVSVTPTVADSTATVTVDGNAVANGQASTVTLNVGSNDITVLVTAQDGSTKTYTVTVTRAPSSNADLSNLTLSAGTLNPSFSSGTTNYTASVGNEVTSVDVTPTVADSTATVTVDGNAVTSGNASTVTLNVGSKDIPVLVTAQDGSMKTYTITITRAQSSNADLSNLTLSAGTLNPSFASGTTDYTASVANGVTGVDVTPTVADSNATVTVDGNAVASGNASTVALDVGSNDITVLVTAQDGTTKRYTVTVTRAQSSNADLSDLTLSEGTLDPAFDSTTTSYSASVSHDSTSVDVTPTVADNNATVTVNGSSVTSGNAATVDLNVGTNMITVTVTAQDGTPKTYTINVLRPSNNADLSNLTLSSGTLEPAFTSATTSYSASVANGVTSVDVTPTVADSNATIAVNGSADTSGNAYNVPLNVGANSITVVVTAQDGTTKTYNITVTRLSNNADLSNLTLSKGTLDPVFASGTTNYTESVANSVTNVDVTPTVADSTATVTVDGDAVTSAHALNVALNAGSNTITIVVTAQDGTTKTYTITVTRAKSSNADLSNLTLSAGTLNPTFATGTSSYTASVANGITNVDITPTVADNTATVTVNGNPATSGQASHVSLNVGANTITVVVTAQDGTTTETYTVTVTRVAPAPTGSGSSGSSGSSGGGSSTPPTGPTPTPPSTGPTDSTTTKVVKTGKPGQAFSQTLTAKGLTGPTTWTLVSGSLQNGLKLNSDGTITGATKQTKPQIITVKAVDENGNTQTQQLVIDAAVPAKDREMVWNGNGLAAENVPAVVAKDSGNNTTFLPVYYVMQALKSYGINSSWNGHDWVVNGGSKKSSKSTAKNQFAIYLNGKKIESAKEIVAKDPNTNQATTYIPIWYVQQLMNALGIQNTWNGSSWVIGVTDSSNDSN